MKKTVLITGGGKGIGAAIAKCFAMEGYNIAICYNNSKDKALSLCRSLNEHGIASVALKADVCSSSEVEKMVEEVKFHFGGIDVLVNNAGIAQQKLLTDITDSDWRRMIDTDLGGVFNCCRAVIPGMISAKSGVIINIASMWGQVGASCEAHYAAAKAGVIALTKSLAKELGPSGIRVNCISPGAIETDMMSGFTLDDIAALIDETPLMRIGRPEDVAEAVYFLASEKASFITGQDLGVNGGFIV